MTARTLIESVRKHGGTITIQGDGLHLKAPEPLPSDLLAQLKAHKPEIIRELRAANDGVDLQAALELACQDLDITSEQFHSLLEPADVEAILAGHIPVHTLAAYAKSMTEGLRSGRLSLLPDQGMTHERG